MGQKQSSLEQKTQLDGAIVTVAPALYYGSIDDFHVAPAHAITSASPAVSQPASTSTSPTRGKSNTRRPTALSNASSSGSKRLDGSPRGRSLSVLDSSGVEVKAERILQREIKGRRRNAIQAQLQMTPTQIIIKNEAHHSPIDFVPLQDTTSIHVFGVRSILYYGGSPERPIAQSHIIVFPSKAVAQAVESYVINATRANTAHGEAPSAQRGQYPFLHHANSPPPRVATTAWGEEGERGTADERSGAEHKLTRGVSPAKAAAASASANDATTSTNKTSSSKTSSSSGRRTSNNDNSTSNNSNNTSNNDNNTSNNDNNTSNNDTRNTDSTSGDAGAGGDEETASDGGVGSKKSNSTMRQSQVHLQATNAHHHQRHSATSSAATRTATAHATTSSPAAEPAAMESGRTEMLTPTAHGTRKQPRTSISARLPQVSVGGAMLGSFEAVLLGVVHTRGVPSPHLGHAAHALLTAGTRAANAESLRSFSATRLRAGQGSGVGSGDELSESEEEEEGEEVEEVAAGAIGAKAGSTRRSLGSGRFLQRQSRRKKGSRRHDRLSSSGVGGADGDYGSGAACRGIQGRSFALSTAEALKANMHEADAAALVGVYAQGMRMWCPLHPEYSASVPLHALKFWHLSAVNKKDVCVMIMPDAAAADRAPSDPARASVRHRPLQQRHHRAVVSVLVLRVMKRGWAACCLLARGKAAGGLGATPAAVIAGRNEHVGTLVAAATHSNISEGNVTAVALSAVNQCSRQMECRVTLLPKHITFTTTADSYQRYSVSNANIKLCFVISERKDLKTLRSRDKHNWQEPLLVVVFRHYASGPHAHVALVFRGEQLEVLCTAVRRASTITSAPVDIPSAFRPIASTAPAAVSREAAEAVVDRDALTPISAIGKGQFGYVYLADYAQGGQVMRCAIKLLKPSAPEPDEENFLKELEIIRVLQHENVVSFVGSDVRVQPWLIAIEFVPYGDVRRVLAQLQDSGIRLSHLEMMKVALQVTDAMVYISSRRFMHMDLALRNCLLGPASHIKICDFGLTQQLAANTGTWRVNHWSGKMPVKWLPPETLFEGIFSAKSDVWSFGILLWELYSYGATPYGSARGPELQKRIRAGLRPSKPYGCPDLIYQLCRRCWSEARQQRPEFADVRQELQSFARSIRLDPQPYRDIGMAQRAACREKAVVAVRTISRHRLEAELPRDSDPHVGVHALLPQHGKGDCLPAVQEEKRERSDVAPVGVMLKEEEQADAFPPPEQQQQQQQQQQQSQQRQQRQQQQGGLAHEQQAAGAVAEAASADVESSNRLGRHMPVKAPNETPSTSAKRIASVSDTSPHEHMRESARTSASMAAVQRQRIVVSPPSSSLGDSSLGGSSLGGSSLDFGSSLLHDLQGRHSVDDVTPAQTPGEHDESAC